MYKLLRDALTNETYGASFTNADGSSTSFLFDPANTDYQEYLKWLEAGNTPLPAEEQSTNSN